MGRLSSSGTPWAGSWRRTAAAGRDDVQALVYVSAFAPDAGETPLGLSGKFPGSTLGDTLVEFPLADGGTDLYIDQAKYHEQFAADLPAGEAAVMAATQRPITAAALGDPSGAPAWRTIPSWWIFGERDRNIPAAALRWMAERAGARRVVEVEGASHVVGISHPDAVAELIMDAVRATQPVAVPASVLD